MMPMRSQQATNCTKRTKTTVSWCSCNSWFVALQEV